MERYENLYVDDVNFDNSVTRHLTPPRFIAGETCIRMFFVRFELFKNSFNQNWSDALSINIVCNFVCDKTLLVIFNFPPVVQNSYQRTKRYLITYFASGDTNEMLWHELNNRRQKLSQTVIEYFNDLLALNKILQVPRPILKQIFVAGLRPEIQNYLGLHGCEDITLQQVFYLAKKFEVIDNSEIFGKTKDCDEQVRGQLFNDEIPRCMLSGNYANRGKENYTTNNLEKGTYNEVEKEIPECSDNNFISKFPLSQFQEYETGNLNNCTDNEFYTPQNEFSHQKLSYQTRNYHSQQPRCAVIQMRKRARNSNFSEVKKRRVTSNVFSQDKQNILSVPQKEKINYGENDNSFASLGSRRRRMKVNYSNKNRFLNRDNKVADYQDYIAQQNSDIPQGKKISHKNKPYVSVVTAKEDNLGKESNNEYISIAAFLIEDVDLEPKMVTKTFINGKIEKGSTINMEGSWFIRNKLLVLF